MTVPFSIRYGLAPLFERAEREGLWFHCAYQDLWFSPAELKKEQAAGRFRWGAINWTLRKPTEHIAELKRKTVQAQNELREAEARVSK